MPNSFDVRRHVARLIATVPRERRAEMTSFPRAFAALRGPSSSFHKLGGLRRRRPTWRPAARRARPISSPSPAHVPVAASGRDGSAKRDDGSGSDDGGGSSDPPSPPSQALDVVAGGAP